MKKTLIGTTMALGLFASTAFADGDAPVMQMDESIVKNQTAIGANPESTFIPLIILTLMIILAAKGGGSSAPVMPMYLQPA